MSRILIRPPAPAPSTFRWEEQAVGSDAPHLMHFHPGGMYDELSESLLYYVVPNDGNCIYASAYMSYKTLLNEWTVLGGSSPATNTCSSPAGWPPNRHPVQMMTIDRVLSKMHLFGGVCLNNLQADHWEWSLAVDPTGGSITQISASGSMPAPDLWGHSVMTPQGVIVVFGAYASGASETWVWCPSASPDATQQSFGCLTGRTWYKTVGPTVAPEVPTYTKGYLNSMSYSAALGKVILFTQDEATQAREIWAYNLTARSWAKLTGTTGTPVDNTYSSTGSKDHILIPTGPHAGKFIAQIPNNRATGSAGGKTYLYDSLSNAYTELPTVGDTGPEACPHLGWDESCDRLVSIGGLGGVLRVHQGWFE